MSSGDELLAELAERPFDRALRLVFADWLQEQGDPRGEVIALGAKGSLSLTQRRRVQRLIEQHAAAWLGPLVTVADVPACRWDGGFLDTFVAAGPPEPAWRVPPDVPPELAWHDGIAAPPPARRVLVQPQQASHRAPGRSPWLDVVGDRGLASVRSLTFPLVREPEPVVPFLVHPVLRHVTRLQLGVELLEALGRTPVAFSPRTLALASWGTFGRELALLGQLEVMKGARRLELITTEFINPIVAGEVRSMVLAHPAGVAHFDEIRLVARYGVVEGAAAWLLRGNEARRVETELFRTRRWSVEYGDVGFTLDRAAGGDRFAALTVDLSGGADGATGLGQRVATASSVLVQLAPGALTRVDVALPAGSGLRPGEKDALRAAVRRLGTVTEFLLGTTPVLP